MTKMGLARLPDELILTDAGELDHKDLNTLIKMSPHFDKFLAPYLHGVALQIAEGGPPTHLAAAGNRPPLIPVTLLRLGVNPGLRARWAKRGSAALQPGAPRC